ncbi:MAG TPA: hypothetical protein VMZ52_10220 [Bryobacteraceae bacterium]|nr:hypothetical protein [Bryobacteraceae bacterium]
MESFAQGNCRVWITAHVSQLGCAYSQIQVVFPGVICENPIGPVFRAFCFRFPAQAPQHARVTFQSGRDILSAPGFWNWDASLFKDFFLTEAVRLQFRAEFFDALNQVRFNPPYMDVSSPFFAQIQSAQPPRIIQLGLRLQF